MKKSIIFLVLMLTVISCTPYRYLKNHEVDICNDCIEKYVDIDTVFKSDTMYLSKIDTIYSIPDTTIKELYFECDSNNNVLLWKVVDLENSKVRLNYSYNNSRLLLRAYGDSISYYKEQIKIITESKNQIVTKEKLVEVPLKFIPWWYWLIFGISCIILFILGILINK